MKRCDLDSETVTVVSIIGLVLILILIRSCIPLDLHHPAERPATPPESFYTPGG